MPKPRLTRRTPPPVPMGHRSQTSRSPVTANRTRQRWYFLAITLLAGASILAMWELRRARLDKLAKREAEVAGEAVAPPADEAARLAAYAGSASCKQCHAAAYDTWAGSHHGLAERPLRDDLDRPAFDPPRSFTHATQKTDLRRDGPRFILTAVGLSNKPEPHETRRVLGVAPLRQFLVDAPGGRAQATEAAYDPAKNEWFNVYGSDDRMPGEWGHWTGRGMNWNSQCAYCHNTSLRKNYDELTDSYATRMVEAGVGCESCHGPLKSHVDWQRARPQPATGDPTVKGHTLEQTLDTCGSCHARRAELTDRFAPGENFFDHFGLNIPDQTDTFHPDGQIHEEDYEFTSFLQSKMNAAGVRCIHCHEAHTSRPRLAGNQLCMQCHAAELPTIPAIDPATHAHHKLETPGGRCVDCHMPTTPFMQRHNRHDHGFTIPDPLLTRQLKIPNACDRCHADKGLDWQVDAIDKWYGPKMQRPTRTRARTIALARAGDAAVVPALLHMATEETIPLWRATAVTLLHNWCVQPTVLPVLIERTRDAHPMVRGAAARALEPLIDASPNVRKAIEPLLADGVRMVRIDAAWVLRRTVDLNSPAAGDLLGYLRQSMDQPRGAMQLGTFHLDRGEVELALTYIRRAAQWDAAGAGAHQVLAMALSRAGRNREALAELQAACRLAPRDADYRFQLGLAYAELHDLPNTTASLQQATRLDPNFARAWYNLGLAYNEGRQPEQAIFALERAESLDRTSPEPPYARATILVQMNRIADARAAAQKALAINPAYAPAARILRELSQSGN